MTDSSTRIRLRTLPRPSTDGALPSGGRTSRPGWAIGPRAAALAQVALTLLVGSLAAIVALAAPPIGTVLEGQEWLWLRIPLGLLAIFLAPGYALAVFLFPRFGDLDSFERVGGAVGLSLAQYPLLAVGLDRSPWGLSPPAIIASVTLLTWTWGLAAVVRLVWVSPDHMFTSGWPSPFGLTRLSRLERLTAVAAIGLLAAVGWSVWLLVSQPAVPPLTEFFALGSDGLAQNYPSTAARNQPISITLGVRNLEGQSLDYSVSARADNASLADVPQFRLESGETRTITLTLALSDYGFGQRVDLLLFRSDMTDPYRRLALVIDVPQIGVPTPVRIASTPAPTVVRADPTAANPVVPTPVVGPRGP